MDTDADIALRELAEGALSGSGQQAWTAFDRAWPAILRRLATFQRALGVRPKFQDDCGQAVLLRVWKSRLSYSGDSLPEFLGWMHTICRREHSRLLELDARHPRPESDLESSRPDEDLKSRPLTHELHASRTTEARVGARDELSALEKCISKLDDGLREVTELLYSADSMSEREVAGVLGCSKSQVNVLRHKALQFLAACMREKGGSDD